MKLRNSVRFVALALLFGALAAGAAPTEKTEAPSLAAAKTADSVLSTPVSACDSKADAKLQIALAPSLAWLSATSQGLGGKCGTCGDPVCNGQNVGAICAFDGVNWYACINLYSNSCPASGGRSECFCTTSGPL